MVHSVSSADPEKLVQYADIANDLDQTLVSQSNSLTASLNHYEATCTEPGFRASAGGLGSALRSYARDLFPFDDWVRQIGQRFAWADGLQLGSRSGLIRGGSPKEWWPQAGSRELLLATLLGPPAWLFLMVSRLPWVRSRGAVPAGETELGHLMAEHESQQRVPSSAEVGPSDHPETQTRLGGLLRESAHRPAASIRAESVPASDGDITKYGHLSEESGKYSNCTWYAAAAVKAASAGTINIGSERSLGHAWEWAESAREAIRDSSHPYHEYIADVNRIPRIGSVYCLDNHVAFVEHVELVEADGKKEWSITLSEENYYSRKAFSGSTEVEVTDHPEIKRWRRTITLDDVDGQIPSDRGEFIHFNYGES